MGIYLGGSRKADRGVGLIAGRDGALLAERLIYE